jgi:leucyl aminopeptidase
MRKIIAVDLKARNIELNQCKTDILVLGHFSDRKTLDRSCSVLGRKLTADIKQVIKLGDFKGDAGTSALFYGDSKIAAQRVLLVGLGDKKKATIDTLRKAAAQAAKKAVALKAKRLSLALHCAIGGKFDTATLAQAMAEGIHFGSYRYDEFVTPSKNGRQDSLKVEFIDPDPAKAKLLKKGLSRGATIGAAQSYARTIANRPGNIITPAELAKAARALARTNKNLACTVMDEKQLVEKGMGGILAVGSGSINKPRLMVLKYKGAGTNSPTVALVGKAITFDSGGISIKPAARMEEMKLDKSGGIAVLATMKAVAELKPRVNVYGIIPSAENLPGGASYRPGDIVTTYSGKTVEVQNTDAEGRMILCDGIAYAVKQKCETIIDIATLTGACKVALGSYMAGLMGNNDALVKQLQKASEQSGEKVWHLPSGDEYVNEMKNKISDLKNIGSRWGGASTAAAFLSQFVGDKKWAHIDMAGVEMFEKATEFTSEGSSGFGVRLLTTYLLNLAEK